MITIHTFLDKCNTIVKGSEANLSQNPIVEMRYGYVVSRGLIHFDHGRIKELCENGTYPDMFRLKHTLHMFNCGSVNAKSIGKPVNVGKSCDIMERATSFDLVFFLIPNDWDSGIGSEYNMDIFPSRRNTYSEYGSNWFNSSTLYEWDEMGIYTTKHIEDALYFDSDEYEDSSDMERLPRIIATQHFEMGNESINIDITDVVNSFILGLEENHGIGIAFFPEYENMSTENTQYVGFFGNNTHSFFKPYVETTYDDYVRDDRESFYLDKGNRLYFYANVNGRSVKLDSFPTCSIDGVEYEVKCATKGVYYIDICLESDEISPETMLYDTWGNIYYNGRKMPDVELYFTTKAPDGYYRFGLPSSGRIDENYVPSIYGIPRDGRIVRGDIIKLNVLCRIPFTSNQTISADGMEYRIFTRQGEMEIDVIPWSTVDMEFLSNYFVLDTNSLVPAKYDIDIRVTRNHEVNTYRGLLPFEIVQEANKIKR